ncbi:polysaccharide pyruvyl transferase family protein [Arthrobacter sp. CDRTa11]|uniref:polysaccharide pyruvyl transferase family protein n=1 Tax=Arthrobacter sp. CDRTa11 TaxID=2651199 RepID=UPI003A5CD5C8
MRLHGGDALTNFGDELSPLVLRYVSGRSVRWAPPHRAEVVSVGSILEYVNRRTTNQPWIWGTGLRAEADPAALPRIAGDSDRVLAVRGPLSRQSLRLAPDLAIGDPGVFAPEISRFKGLRRSGTLFIPHFRTWSTRSGRSLLKEAESLGYTIGNPSLHPIEMMSLIARADFVLSSSLHGVIVAHSLGVPVQLVTIPASGRNEPAFKYNDYFQSIGVNFNSVDLASALIASKRKPLLSLRADEAPIAKANAAKLAENLTHAIERIR